MILARILNIKLKILDTDQYGLVNEHTFDCNPACGSALTIQRCSEHYNDIITALPSRPTKCSLMGKTNYFSSPVLANDISPSPSATHVPPTEQTSITSRLHYDPESLKALNNTKACPPTRLLRKSLFELNLWGQHYGCDNHTSHTHWQQFRSRQIPVHITMRRPIHHLGKRRPLNLTSIILDHQIPSNKDPDEGVTGL